MTRHTRAWKEGQVQELQQLSEKYPVIAVASIKNFPGALAKAVRKKLQGKAVVKVSKTRAVALALGKSKAETKELEKHLKGSIAIIFTEMNPFELYAFLKKNKVSMPAKAGAVASNDIVVPAGDTGLPPGPALSDLKAAGLKTVMKGPTISIAEDKVVAKKGEAITEAIAGALGKLGIKPIKVGLNIMACLEKGQVFLGEVLDIDTDRVRADFGNAARAALNLAVEVAYLSKETAPILVTRGFRNARAVSLEAGILNKETAAEILGKANAQASALKAMVKEAPPEEKNECQEAKEKPEGKKEGAQGEKEKKADGKEGAEEKKGETKKEPKKEEAGKEGKKPAKEAKPEEKKE